MDDDLLWGETAVSREAKIQSQANSAFADEGFWEYEFNPLAWSEASIPPMPGCYMSPDQHDLTLFILSIVSALVEERLILGKNSTEALELAV